MKIQVDTYKNKKDGDRLKERNDQENTKKDKENRENKWVKEMKDKNEWVILKCFSVKEKKRRKRNWGRGKRKVEEKNSKYTKKILSSFKMNSYMNIL